MYVHKYHQPNNYHPFVYKKRKRMEELVPILIQLVPNFVQFT